MGTDKRERKKANRAAKLQAEQAAEARRRRMRTIRNMTLVGLVLVLAMIVMGTVGCGSEAAEDDAASTTPTADEAAEPTEAECPPADGVDEPVIDFAGPPPTCTDPDTTYTATFETSEGDVVVELSGDTPITTNNFVFLARWGYFDGTDLFRTEAQSGIIQGGSPHTQDNTDPGPGYTISDEGLPWSSDDYGPGTLAMARTAAPNSASGQFFFLANEGGRYLGDPAQLGESAGTYVPFGTVTEGLEVLEAIAALDTGAGVPAEQVTIDRVTITEG